MSVVPDAPLPKTESHFSFYQEVVHHSTIDGNDLGATTQHVTNVKVGQSGSYLLVRGYRVEGMGGHGRWR